MPPGTRAKLDARGIAAPTGHVGMADLRTRLDWVADQARTVGIEQLFMPAVPLEEREMEPAGWRAVGAELGGMAQRLQAQGLALGYHNHHWELIAVPGRPHPARAAVRGGRRARR